MEDYELTEEEMLALLTGAEPEELDEEETITLEAGGEVDAALILAPEED